MVGVGGAGHVAGGGGVVYQAILGIEGIPTRIVHGLANVADAKFEVAWVVVMVGRNLWNNASIIAYFLTEIIPLLGYMTCEWTAAMALSKHLPR